MKMSDELKLAMAREVYNRARSAFLLHFPFFKEWEELSTEEQRVCGESMRIWLAGLGSNEIGSVWFKRSGNLPRSIWDQLPDTDHEVPFEIAALDLIIELIRLAELGLKHQETMGLVRDLWQVIDEDEDVKILAENHLGSEWMDSLRERTKNLEES